MYQVIYNSNGPERNKKDTFCIAGSRCAKCHWFIKNSRATVAILGKKKTVQVTICGFNKKPYDDMRHKLTICKNGESV
jgi:hypothetical protein